MVSNFCKIEESAGEDEKEIEREREREKGQGIRGETNECEFERAASQLLPSRKCLDGLTAS